MLDCQTDSFTISHLSFFRTHLPILYKLEVIIWCTVSSASPNGFVINHSYTFIFLTLRNYDYLLPCLVNTIRYHWQLLKSYSKVIWALNIWKILKPANREENRFTFDRFWQRNFVSLLREALAITCMTLSFFTVMLKNLQNLAFKRRHLKLFSLLTFSPTCNCTCTRRAWSLESWNLMDDNE